MGYLYIVNGYICDPEGQHRIVFLYKILRILDTAYLQDVYNCIVGKIRADGIFIFEIEAVQIVCTSLIPQRKGFRIRMQS